MENLVAINNSINILCQTLDSVRWNQLINGSIQKINEIFR